MTHQGESFRHAATAFAADLQLQRCVRRAVRSGCVPLRGAFITVGLMGVVPADAAQFPAVFPLVSLLPAGGGDGTRGFVLNGIDQFDHSGISVSAAGDVNADGIGDLIIGAGDADPGGTHNAGESYIVFGGARGFPAVFPLASLYPAGGGDGTRGFVMTGNHEYDFAGHSVSAAGDVNGDGIDDVIIGAWSGDARRDAGLSYVVFGSTQGFPAVFELASLNPARGGDGTRGFILTGIDRFDHSGYSVSTAGDVNGDGIDDVIIGARNASPGGRGAAGESYVVFGSAQGFPAVFPLASLFPGHGDGSRGFVLTGINSSQFSGSAVSEAGDVNADGIGDLVVGGMNTEAAYVVFGSAQGFPAAFPLASLHDGGGRRGFVLSGQDAGSSVSAAGDVNGDGIDDLIVSRPGADAGGPEDSGASYVVFGSTRRFPAVLGLASLEPGNGGDGTQGFVLGGIRESDFSGTAVSGAGDVDGDGIGDVIIGARLADPDGHDDAGESYVVFGSAQGLPALFPLAELYPDGGGDGTRGFVLPGVAESDRSGVAVSAAGDVNADGIDDVIIGAYQADYGERGSIGQSYVVFGRSAAR